MTRTLQSLVLAVWLLAAASAVEAQVIVDHGEDTRIVTLSGEQVPTAIVLEQFALMANTVLMAEAGHGSTPWQNLVLAPLGMETGSMAAILFENFARDLASIFSGQWTPSASAVAEKSAWKREQSEFNRGRLSMAARATASMIRGFEKSGRSALSFLDFLNEEIRPQVSTLVIGTPEEWENGDPVEEFVREWSQFDLELTRMVSQEEMVK